MLSGECSFCRRIYADASLGYSSLGCIIQPSLESKPGNSSSVRDSSWHKERNLDSNCNACTGSRNVVADKFALFHSTLLSRLDSRSNYILGRKSDQFIFLEAAFVRSNRVSGPHV